MIVNQTLPEFRAVPSSGPARSIVDCSSDIASPVLQIFAAETHKRETAISAAGSQNATDQNDRKEKSSDWKFAKPYGNAFPERFIHRFYKSFSESITSESRIVWSIIKLIRAACRQILWLPAQSFGRSLRIDNEPETREFKYLILRELTTPSSSGLPTPAISLTAHSGTGSILHSRFLAGCNAVTSSVLGSFSLLAGAVSEARLLAILGPFPLSV